MLGQVFGLYTPENVPLTVLLATKNYRRKVSAPPLHRLQQVPDGVICFCTPSPPLKDKIILPQKNFPVKKGSRSKVGHSPLISSNLTASLGVTPSVQHTPRRQFTQKLEHLHVSAHLRHQWLTPHYLKTEKSRSQALFCFLLANTL